MLLSKGIDISAIFGHNIIELPDISDKTGKEIAADVGKKWCDIEFDHTVGSIFIPISTMRQRFEDCDRFKKCILSTCHLLHKCGIYKEKQTFPLEWIKIVCQKKYGLDAKELEWDEWLGNLTREELIKLIKDKKIWVEEVYLERIFKPTLIESDIFLYREMIDYFSENPEVFFDCPEVLFRFANNAYYVIGISDDKKIKLYNLAKDVCEIAIEKTTPKSIEYAHFQKLLGISYRVLSEIIEKDQISNAEKAIFACEEACCVFESNKDFLIDYALSKSDLWYSIQTLRQVNTTN